MSYVPGAPPSSLEPRTILEFLTRELTAVARAMDETTELRLVSQHVAPAKPRDGMLVKADGSDWDPGSGEGAYVYYAGAWHFLG